MINGIVDERFDLVAGVVGNDVDGFVTTESLGGAIYGSGGSDGGCIGISIGIGIGIGIVDAVSDKSESSACEKTGATDDRIKSGFFHYLIPFLVDLVSFFIPIVVRIMMGSARMRRGGRKQGTTKILMTAPRAISIVREEIMSALEKAATPTVAAKRTAPETRMDGMEVLRAMWAADFLSWPARRSRL